MIKLKKIKNNTINTIKKLSYEKILAFIFLFLIFFIAIGTLPVTFGKLYKEFNKDKVLLKKVESSFKVLDEAYEGMLDFDSSLISNKGTYINLNGFMSNLMGQRVMNDVTVLNNGHLARVSYEELDLSEQLMQVIKLRDKLREENKDFLFVLAPSQISKHEDLLPEELKKENYISDNADKLLKDLRTNDIPYLDLREELYNEGIKHEDAFFKTDHHWKVETSFWAYSKIVNELIENNVISNVDEWFLDISSYDKNIKEGVFLGSSGKRTGKYFAGKDDFPILTPKFETEFKVGFPKKNTIKEGKLEETLLDVKEIEKSMFNANFYRYYGYGAMTDLDITNLKSLTNKDVLIIGDSFSRPTSMFLSTIFNKTFTRDMRYYKGDFTKDYNQMNPDIVLVIINDNNIDENIDYDFFTN